MQFRKNYKLIFFAVFFLSVAFFVIFNLNSIKIFIEENILVYGYIAIFIFSFLADSLEQPIGPEVPASLGIVFGLNFYYVFLFAVIGSYIGSVLSFFVGKFFLNDRVIYLCANSKKKYCDFFKKYGKISLLIASISPVPYVFFCWMSGAFAMKFRYFIIFGLIPRALRILFVMFFIYYIF